MGENFHDCLKGSPESLISDPEASVIGHAFEAFADSGTSHWGHATAEWFIIYLLTEAAVTPHTIRHGNTTLSYLQGFVAIAKELVSVRLILLYVDYWFYWTGRKVSGITSSLSLP
jgi:hypothetical protein